MIRFEGHFDGNVVVPSQSVNLPAGTDVIVTVKEPDDRTVWQRIAEMADEMPEDHLPDDLADLHDHYPHGRPKRRARSSSQTRTSTSPF